MKEHFQEQLHIILIISFNDYPIYAAHIREGWSRSADRVFMLVLFQMLYTYGWLTSTCSSEKDSEE